jgi:hypothetical protein
VVPARACGTLAGMSYESHASDSLDAEAQRIGELVIEAGALVDWVDGGRGDLEVVGAALLYLRDELAALADSTHSADACQSACDMVSAIENTISGGSQRKPGHAAA